MATELSLDDLTKFTDLAWKDVRPEHRVDTLSDGNFGIEDLFGKTPKSVLYAKGDVVASGHLGIFGTDAYSYYIIDGNLTVDGTVTINVADIYQIVVVTGDLRARGLIGLWECQLYVLGKTVIDGPIVSELGDSGALRLRGGAKAKAFVELNDDITMEVTGETDGAELGPDDLLEPFQEADDNRQSLIEAIQDGRPIV